MSRINIQDLEPLDYAPGSMGVAVNYRMGGITLEYPDGRRKRIYNMSVKQLGKFMAVIWKWKTISIIDCYGVVMYSRPMKKWRD